MARPSRLRLFDSPEANQFHCIPTQHPDLANIGPVLQVVPASMNFIEITIDESGPGFHTKLDVRLCLSYAVVVAQH